MPNFKIESAMGGRVAGIDEAGRGPAAGPVVAAAVYRPWRLPRRLVRRIADSKQILASPPGPRAADGLLARRSLVRHRRRLGRRDRPHQHPAGDLLAMRRAGCSPCSAACPTSR